MIISFLNYDLFLKFILNLGEDKCCSLLQVLPFENMKGINLRHCESIQKLPKLRAPNLEILDLSYCTNLVEIHEPTGFLDKLKTWYLTGCKKLRALPRRLKFKSLEHFYLDSCQSIEELPKLCARNSKTLNLSNCKHLVKVHESDGLLNKLETWDLSYCGKLQSLPRLTLECLELLNLCGSGVRELPSSRCTSLESKLPDSIYKFQKSKCLCLCTNIPRPIYNSFDGSVGYGFLQLEELNLFGENVIELGVLEFDYFPSLRYLTLENTNTVTVPKSFIKFTTLRKLYILNCKQFEEIQGLPQSLNLLMAINCPSWNPQSSNKILSQVFLYHSIAQL